MSASQTSVLNATRMTAKPVAGLVTPQIVEPRDHPWAPRSLRYRARTNIGRRQTHEDASEKTSWR